MDAKEALVIVGEADYTRDDWQEALATLCAAVDERDALKAEVVTLKQEISGNDSAHRLLLAEVEGLRTQPNYPDPEDMPGELAAKYCPFKDPLHFHHDGCPSEWAQEQRIERAEIDLAHTIERAKKAEAEVERLQVQLAGCATAALGWNEKPVKNGDYGWSPAYQDVLELRMRCEKAEAELAAARRMPAPQDITTETDRIQAEYADKIRAGGKPTAPQGETPVGFSREGTATHGGPITPSADASPGSITAEGYNPALSGQGLISREDEDAINVLRFFLHTHYGFEHPGLKGEYAALDYLKARLQQPSPEANKAVSVTREQIEKFIPCICIDAYKDRGLAQPDCPRCSMVDMDGLMAEVSK